MVKRSEKLALSTRFYDARNNIVGRCGGTIEPGLCNRLLTCVAAAVRVDKSQNNNILGLPLPCFLAYSAQSICGSGFFTPKREWEWERKIHWEWERELEWEQIIFREWIREDFYCMNFALALASDTLMYKVFYRTDV
jgi:hypothetical protein